MATGDPGFCFEHKMDASQCMGQHYPPAMTSTEHTALTEAQVADMAERVKAAKRGRSEQQTPLAYRGLLRTVATRDAAALLDERRALVAARDEWEQAYVDVCAQLRAALADRKALVARVETLEHELKSAGKVAREAERTSSALSRGAALRRIERNVRAALATVDEEEKAKP